MSQIATTVPNKVAQKQLHLRVRLFYGFQMKLLMTISIQLTNIINVSKMIEFTWQFQQNSNICTHQMPYSLYTLTVDRSHTWWRYTVHLRCCHFNVSLLCSTSETICQMLFLLQIVSMNFFLRNFKTPKGWLKIGVLKVVSCRGFWEW